MSLEKVIRTLRTLNEPVPKPPRLPVCEEIKQIEHQIGMSFHPDLRQYFLEASDVVYGVFEPVTIPADSGHTSVLNVIEQARSIGVPDTLVPICETNADYYCMTSHGTIVFWSHDASGLTGEQWDDLATWIEEVWIQESQDLEDDEEEE